MIRYLLLAFLILTSLGYAFADVEETIDGSKGESAIIEATRSAEFETYFTFAAISLIFLTLMWLSYSAKARRNNY